MVRQLGLTGGLESVGGNEHAPGIGRVLGVVKGEEVRRARRKAYGVVPCLTAARAQRVTCIDQPGPLVRFQKLAKPCERPGRSHEARGRSPQGGCQRQGLAPRLRRWAGPDDQSHHKPSKHDHREP